jgi:hypothetical protein
MNDLDEPDSLPGYCPVCNNKADIWDAKTRHYECRLCDWTGRSPNPRKSGWCRETQELY